MGAIGSIVAKVGETRHAKETLIKSDPPVELPVEYTIDFIESESSIVEPTLEFTL